MKRWMLLVVMAAGCSKGPSGDQCKQLLDHLVDLEIKKAGAAEGTTDAMKAELAKQKTAVLESKSKEFISACTEKTSKVRVECALAANDLDAVARCDEGP